MSYQLVEEEEGDSNQAPATRSSQVSTTGKLFPNVKVRPGKRHREVRPTIFPITKVKHLIIFIVTEYL